MARFKVLVVALVAGLLRGLATAELETYQEVEPQDPDLESLVRFLEAQTILRAQQQQQQQEAQHQRQLQQDRNLQHHRLELARQKQHRKIFRDDLPERPNIIDVLEREDPPDPLEFVREIDRQRLLPYLEYEPAHPPKPYIFEDEPRARLPSHRPVNKMLDYPESQYEDLAQAQLLENARRTLEAIRRARPEFTYSFPDPEPRVEGGPPPFGYRPNDPRYYEEDHSSKADQQLVEETPDDQKSREEITTRTEPPSTTTTTRKPRQKPPPKHLESSMVGGEKVPENNLIQVSMLPEPRRRAEYDPVVVRLGHKVNDDIYFIAIVAGCSAAAMFALVLISLTWCRLQRNSKAAADVEYPAYGVTGPNKDISPSGDQRLAQSAQMYHFQHQKQQIIAMEKASAARDPGSVSEAESDEENEEGDYTVYECPGLAPTGEMEVKNPMFHDDPTPATPKSKKDDDDDDEVN